MTRYRRISSMSDRKGGVMACYSRPSDAMRGYEPPRPCRLAPIQSARSDGQGACMMRECQRPVLAGGNLCDVHERKFRFYCEDCGRYILSEKAMERNGGTHCLPCWNKTPEGRAFARGET